MTGNVSRRSVAKGAAWAAPAIYVGAAAPALAASSTASYTSTSDTPQVFFNEYNYTPGGCNGSSIPSGGYIDTQGCTPTGGPADAYGRPGGDCQRNTQSSIGYWLETTNLSSGTAAIGNVTTTFTFSQPIKVDSCPNGVYNASGTVRWSECTTLNGWTYALSADGKTLTMSYTGTYAVTSSTSAAGSGTYLPGYFINYRFASYCMGSATIRADTTLTYYDKTYPSGQVWARSGNPIPI